MQHFDSDSGMYSESNQNIAFEAVYSFLAAR